MNAAAPTTTRNLRAAILEDRTQLCCPSTVCNCVPQASPNDTAALTFRTKALDLAIVRLDNSLRLSVRKVLPFSSFVDDMAVFYEMSPSGVRVSRSPRRQRSQLGEGRLDGRRRIKLTTQAAFRLGVCGGDSISVVLLADRTLILTSIGQLLANGVHLPEMK